MFLVFVLFCAGLYSFPIAIMESDFSMIPGDLGDARFNTFILEHGYQFFTGRIDDYWNARFLYPTPNVIAYSDNLLGTLPFYSLPRLMGFDRETCFQIWFITLVALNFICCFLALHKWFGHTILAAVGAYIFAFGLFNLGQSTNAQVFPKFMLPLIFFWTWRYFSTREIRYLLLLVLGIVYQFYCGFYLGFFAVYAILFLLASYLIVYRDMELFQQFRNRDFTLKFTGILVLAIALLLPLMLPYIEASATVGMRKFSQILHSIPRVRSYFFAFPTSVLWGGILYEHSAYAFDSWWDHWIFPGALAWIGILLLPIVYFKRRKSALSQQFVLYLASAFLLSMVFCLNFGGISAYKLIYELPGFSSMRALTRIIHVEVLFFIVPFIYAVQELSRFYPRFKFIIYLLPILVFLDHAHVINSDVRRFSKSEATHLVDKAVETIRKNHNPIYDVVGYQCKNDSASHAEIIYHHITAMLAGQEIGITLVNGYTGSYPDNYMDFFDHMDEHHLQIYCESSGLDRDRIQLIPEE